MNSHQRSLRSLIRASRELRLAIHRAENGVASAEVECLGAIGHSLDLDAQLIRFAFEIRSMASAIELMVIVCDQSIQQGWVLACPSLDRRSRDPLGGISSLSSVESLEALRTVERFISMREAIGTLRKRTNGLIHRLEIAQDGGHAGDEALAQLLSRLTGASGTRPPES